MSRRKLLKTAVSLLLTVVFIFPMITTGMGENSSGAQGASPTAVTQKESLINEPSESLRLITEMEFELPPPPPAQEPEAAVNNDVSDIDTIGYESFSDTPTSQISPALTPFKGTETAVLSEAAASVKPLNIKRVEVINGGSTQVQYRPEVYSGSDPVFAKNGEDPNKYYTTRRSFSTGDPRVFSFELDVSLQELTEMGVYNGTGTPSTDQLNAFLAAVDFTYGGYPLSRWANGKDWRGSSARMALSNKAILEVSAGGKVTGYKVTADVRYDSPYSLSTAAAANNRPYASYPGFTQGTFGDGQNVDNRQLFTIGPANKGPGTYVMEAAATIGGTKHTLAAKDIFIGLYDGYHTWNEISEYAQSLIVALNGVKADTSKKPLGILAKGTLIKDVNGEYKKSSNGVYIEVSILNYSNRDNPIWNVVVSRDAKTINDYLKPGGVKDQMNDNPQALINKYKNANPEDIDLIIPFYSNNVHSDELTGTDSIIQLTDDLIAGGKAGKNVSYKTFQSSDITWNYRPAGTNSTSYTGTTYNHVADTSKTRQPVTMRTNEILDKFIIVNTLASNPDGKELFRRVNKFGLDLNRDTVFATQPETIALTEDIAKWDPIAMIEWHGYVSQMLIEPCTAPHSQNYEPDLTLNNMIQLAYYMGKAVTGSTGLSRFELPWDAMSSGWDDGGNVYGPMFSMLFGAMGWTIELPFANEDCFDGGNAMTYAILNALMKGETAVYPGNHLNHLDTPSDSSMRKSTILNKLEFKRRGVDNIDSEVADKYFIDVVNGQRTIVGRNRKTDTQGNQLPYFPDYLVIPGTPDTQWNVAEALRTLEFTRRYGAKVQISTEPVTYNGVTYEAGTYLYDMRQGRRNFISEIMSKGYDASNFATMYADIYCNFPDTRGFDCVEVWSPGLFDGKTKEVTTSIEKINDIKGEKADYIVFKSNSTDAVRFVNLLLSGRSSGPSVTNGTAPVWMLRKSVDGVGVMSDYIIEAKSFNKIYDLKDNPDLGIHGCYLEAKYISDLPEEAVELVNPVISLNTTRTINSLDASGSLGGGAIYWALDDFLGFSSMKDGNADYTGNSSAIRDGANVVIQNGTSALSAAMVTTIKNNKLALINIQSAASLTNANFGVSNTSAPATAAISDAAFYGTYNVDDSLYTANYADTRTLYGRGNYFSGTTNANSIPAGSKTLFKTDAENFFIGGYNRNYGTLGSRTTMFSTILKGGGITDKPVQSVSFGANMFYRPHYQKYYPMLATAIFAGAAGILDDQADPVITAHDFVRQADGSIAVSVTAADDISTDSGLALLKLERFNYSTGEYETVSSSESGTLTITDSTANYGKWSKYRLTATDYAGNDVTYEEEFVDYKNSSSNSVNILKYVALYSDDGQLKLIERFPAVKAEGGETIRVNSDLPAEIESSLDDGCYANVYVWNGDSLVPVADKYRVN